MRDVAIGFICICGAFFLIGGLKMLTGVVIFGLFICGSVFLAKAVLDSGI